MPTPDPSVQPPRLWHWLDLKFSAQGFPATLELLQGQGALSCLHIAAHQFAVYVFLQWVQGQQPMAIGDGRFESLAESIVTLQPLEHPQEEKLQPFSLYQAPVIVAALEKIATVQVQGLFQRPTLGLGAGKGACQTKSGLPFKDLHIEPVGRSRIERQGAAFN